MTEENTKVEYHDSFFLWLSYSLIKLFLGGLVRLIWIKKVEGIENIPKKGPVIMAFNHQSFFDFICFIAVSPRHIHYLSAEKFFTNKYWRPFMKATGQIKVNRAEHDKHILHSTVHSHLEHGKMIGIFPEGTRSPHENEMLYAFTGAAKYAVEGKVPVIPVGLKGTYYVMAKHDKKPKFKKVVTIHIGKPIHFTEHHNTKPDQKTYRTITDKIVEEISKLSGRTYAHYGRLE